MPTIQVSTKEEINKAVYETVKLIQKLAKEGQEGNVQSISLLPQLVQSAAQLISSTPYNLLD